MSTFTSFVVPTAGADWQKTTKTIEEPDAGRVRIRVRACGLCHGDCIVKEGYWPIVPYPRAPGHEIAGEVDAVGEGVEGWVKGDRVGVGWYGGCCGKCDICRRGVFNHCEKGIITGIHCDGGYQQYVYVDPKSIVKLPKELSYVEAAPLLCAGLTVYNGLRHCGATPGQTVGVQGIGGLGHMGIQFAVKMGYRVIAFSRGEAKREKAMQLGAHEYIDTGKEGWVEKVKSLGGVDAILATATNSKAHSELLPVLNVFGTFVILGIGPGKVEVDPGFMVDGARKIIGVSSGHSKDAQDTLEFSVLAGVRSVNEVYPPSKVEEAYKRMATGNAQFRVVVDWDLED